MTKATRNFLVMMVGIAAFFGGPVQAQTWPSAPIKLIAPYAAGGAVDIVSRIIAQQLAEILRTPVVVENRPGAGAIVGSAVLAKSAPDGYTILMVNIAHSANPSLHSKLPYDTEKDFAPVILVANLATVLITAPTFPAHTVSELIKLAKAKPGTLNYASAGFGSVNYLAAELFKRDAGIDVVHVPFQGGGPSLTAVSTGQVQMEFLTLPPALPFIKSNRVRALAVTSAKRNPALPDVPTISESGLPGFVITEWYGIVAPAATPKAIVMRLNEAFNQVLAMPQTRDRLSGMGAEVAGGAPERFATRIDDEVERWKKTIKPNMRVD